MDVIGRRLAATAIGWIAAVLAAAPAALVVGGIAVLAGASAKQVIGNGPVGVAVVTLGLHLPAGVFAAATMPAVWGRLVGQSTTRRNAVRVTMPTMIAVAILEVAKASLPPAGYLLGTLLQLAVLLVPLTARGLPSAYPSGEGPDPEAETPAV